MGNVAGRPSESGERRRIPSPQHPPLTIHDIPARRHLLEKFGRKFVIETNLLGEYVDVRLLPRNIRPRIGDPPARPFFVDLGWIQLFIYENDNKLIGSALAVRQPDGKYVPKLFPE